MIVILFEILVLCQFWICYYRYYIGIIDIESFKHFIVIKLLYSVLYSVPGRDAALIAQRLSSYVAVGDSLSLSNLVGGP